MSTNPRFPLLFLVALIFGVGTVRACAQSPRIDEAVGPNGIASQQLTLTPVQRSAIYNAVTRRAAPTFSGNITAAIGAAIPPSADLLDLPGQGAVGENGGFLKYAMVDGDVVVIDPIAMRVVDVIHSGVGP